MPDDKKLSPQEALINTAVVCLIVVALVGTLKLVSWVWSL